MSAESAEAWLKVAKEDLDSANHQMGHNVKHLCFHVQQCIEKTLKAILIFEDTEIPHIHDLEKLFSLIPDGWSIKDASFDFKSISEWAVVGRYPYMHDTLPTIEDTKRYIEMADVIYQSVQSDIQIRLRSI